MEPVGYVIVVLVIVAVVLVALFTLYRGARRRPDLVIHISAPVIRPVTNRPEWYLDFVAELANVSPGALSVTGIRAAVSAPKQAPLDAKRVLGDEEGRRHAVHHPPDIALRVPIEIASGARLNYRFHIIFSVHLRRMWDRGILHLYVTTDRGATYEGLRVLTAPENESAAAPAE